MMTTVLAVLILGGVALYLMTPDERARAGRLALAAARQGLRAATQPTPGGPFDEFLRARTGRPVVTPLLAALSALLFARMLFAPGSIGDVETLVSWGGNIAPRTTGGEWWRLLTATFVHGGLLHLVATIAGLMPLGLVLERAVGRGPFAAMFIASAIASGVVSLWTTSPTNVTVGASGATFGIYGLLLASVMWGVVSRAAVPVPLAIVKRLAAAAAVFVLYNVTTDHLGTASELAGLATGFVGGVVVTRGVTREKPGVPRALAVAAATILIAVVGAVPLRGVVDVRPEMARIAAVEERTARAYDEAVVKFRRRQLSAGDLVQLIDGTIIPELHAARTQLKALRGVPPEQAPFVAAAERYFLLRDESWRRRAVGLLDSDLQMLRKAEETERAALEAFRRTQPAS